jgi:uncharacterized membrane protein
MTPPLNSEISEDDKIWAALGYPIGLIALIMIFIDGKKNRPFIKYHAVQSITLNVILCAVILIIAILGVILGAILAVVTYGIAAPLAGLVSCIFPFLWLLLIWPAVLSYQGKYFEIPVITKILRDQHWIA